MEKRVSIALVCVAICALAMSITSNAQAQILMQNLGNLSQTLFESDFYDGNIYEFTPGGAQSTFASGLSGPTGLAFDSAGNLFAGDVVPGYSGYIYKFTQGRAQSTFRSEEHTSEL